jgi:hypothetical protein
MSHPMLLLTNYPAIGPMTQGAFFGVRQSGGLGRAENALAGAL